MSSLTHEWLDLVCDQQVSVAERAGSKSRIFFNPLSRETDDSLVLNENAEDMVDNQPRNGVKLGLVPSASFRSNLVETHLVI